MPEPEANAPIALFWPVLAGVVLAGVPALFAVFPGEVGVMWVGWRSVVGVAWLVVAVLAVAASARKDDKVARIAARVSELEPLQVAGATVDTLEALLRPGTKGMPGDYSLSVYLFDPDFKRLLPWFPDRVTDLSDPRVFVPGSGATGTSWSDEATQLVTGEEVSSSRYGLTDAQQVTYSAYRSVIASPIFTPSGKKVGVLTAIARGDDGYFGDDAAVKSFEGLARDVGVILARLRP